MHRSLRCDNHSYSRVELIIKPGMCSVVLMYCITYNLSFKHLYLTLKGWQCNGSTVEILWSPDTLILLLA